ncbi:hypothetical protein GQ43DRAFT_376118 [Delitschia confertaspora ATCC 74209]|uniref:Uncharacterized protein n=1 Tax=Delitschia confertaspora ATCC 74209 TaxID=1513339 RepID=A0A9P4MQL8_9PLEO|nr:hypothetical protein GQ43DRAFT_376118 [Delitschia confertaspora ATCC 74209]
MAKEADNWKKTLQTTQQEQQLEQLRLQKEIEEWKKRVKRKEESDQKLSKQLQDARDHIFRLQPRRSFITETEAQEAFEDLFNNIQRWVENRLEGILDELDDGKLTSRPCTADAANRLLSFTFQRARQDFGTARTDEYHVLAIIMQFLNDNLFSRYFYCSLDGASLKGAEDRTVATIQRIESAMAKADRDSSQCREWRFEALNALVSQPQFREAQANLDRSLTENLLELLSILVPRMHLQELRESIGRNIVRPAVGLAHRLHLSTSLFSLRWTPNNNDVETGPIDDSKQDFSHYICYNVLESGKVVKPTVEKDGQPPLRVTYLFDVCPGLYCQSIQSGVLTYPRVICKPKILVAASFGNQVLAPQGPTIFRWLNHAVQHPENGARSLQTGIKNVSQGVKIPQQVANSKQNSSEAPRKPKRKLISSKGAGWFGGSR